MSFDPILLAPQQEEREVFPYRRVWRTALIEIAILLVLTVIAVLVTRFYTGTLTDAQRGLFSVAFAVTPLMLWIIFSYFGERRALLPRERLFAVMLLSVLAANAIGIPLVERVFAVDEWLSTASGSSRILGYALSVGVTQEFLKYLVMRYSVWPQAFHSRSDGIAYAMAASIGYATVVNLNYVFNTIADPGSAALHVAEFTLIQLAVGIIMGYFLAELKLSRDAGVFWVPGGLLFAALLTGLAITFRGGLIVGGIGPNGNASTAFQGLGIAIFLVAVLFASFYFLINNADERSRGRSRTEFTR
ncbi:MAG: PrsW family glutamic-type intramembrane protease [Chloroflexota bacterium]